MTKTLQTDLDTFIQYAGGGQSEHTALTYGNAMKWFILYLTENKLDLTESTSNLTPELIHHYPVWLAKQTFQRTEESEPQPLSENSRSLYLQVTSRLIDYLTKLKRLTTFDATDIVAVKDTLRQATAYKRPPIHQKVPPKAIIQQLIISAKVPPVIPTNASNNYRHRLQLIWRRNLALLITLQYTGLRVGEIVKLKRKDIDWTNQGAYIQGKGRKTRFVPFHNKVLEILEFYFKLRQDADLSLPLRECPLFCRHDRRVKPEERKPLSTRSVHKIITGLAKKADILDKFQLTPHSLRHLFATNLLEQTGDLALTQEALGHADPKTTRVYAQVSRKRLTKAVREMD